MNVYIWTNVLMDYSAGMVVAIAPDIQTALSLPELESVASQLPCDKDHLEIIQLHGQPKAKGWYVYGGG